MPKVVDHDARRRDLAAAALEVVATDGPEALSVRRLVAATGWSSGAIRHYVPDTDALARLLLDQVSGRVQESVAQVLQTAAGLADPPVDTVVECLAHVLPLDTGREVEFAVWRHFWGRNRSGADAAWVWAGQRMFHRQLVLLLDGTSPRELPAYPDDLPGGLERWAGHLHAFADGLALRAGLAVPRPRAAEVLTELRHGVAVVAGGVGSNSDPQTG